MRIESLRELHAQFPDIDGFWNFQDLLQTQLNIQNVLPQGSNPWSALGIEHLTQLARVLALLGSMPEAKAKLDQALELIGTIEASTRTRPLIRYNLEVGRLQCLQMTPAKAQCALMQAWQLANEIQNNYFAIDAALMLSISRPPKFQNEWLMKALELAEKSTDPQAQLWLAQLYMMDGWHCFDFRRFEEAMARFEKALERPRYQGDQSKNYVIRWCIARTKRALGQTQDALAMQKLLLSEMSLTGDISGYVYLEIGENLQLLNAREEAKPYFELAYKELSADGWYSDNRADELSRLQHLYKKRY